MLLRAVAHERCLVLSKRSHDVLFCLQDKPECDIPVAGESVFLHGFIYFDLLVVGWSQDNSLVEVA